MQCIVQKYGGSSVADAGRIKQVASRIAETVNNGARVVAVVSAMGDSTDRLIGLAHEVSDGPEPRELDVLLSTGELVSCTLVAMRLRSIGLDAISLSGAQAGIRTDNRYGKARIAGIDPQRILTELDNGKTVVVAGFQGITEQQDITTLGRGASDLSAVAIAAGLNASRCEIYTDVEGIFTANPNFVPNARKLDQIGYEEMLEMASYGAKMQPRSIEFAKVYNVPVYVASSSETSTGTLIHGEVDSMDLVGEIRNKARSVPTESNVAKITVRDVVDRPGLSASIFEPLADADISVDIIVQNASVGGTTNVTFTVGSEDLQEALDIVSDTAKDIGAGEVLSADNLAKVSVVGTGMQNSPGYASTMFRTLAEAGINIEMISTSEIRITCVIEASSIEDAARALHKAFDLDEES